MYTRLTQSTASFNDMMDHFGVVTVMNADVYAIDDYSKFANWTAYEIYKQLVGRMDATDKTKAIVFTHLCTLDTLKAANVTVDGPDKTISGGRYNNNLIKFGKTATMEIQDALGHHSALDALCGTISEYTDEEMETELIGFHNTEDFSPARMIIGDTFFIDQKTGEQVPVKIMFYQFLPDSIFNLTQDAEGDATVFDMNGELCTTDIKVGTTNDIDVVHGVFYSIIDPNSSQTRAPEGK